MKKIIILSSVLISSYAASAQKKFYTEPAGETSGMSVVAKDAVSTPEYTKFNLKVTNKTNDILLYKPEESKLKANGKDLVPKEKWLQIAPGETDNRVVNFKGPGFMINDYSYELNGVYKISTEKTALDAADFQLPPAQNEFKAGNFSCNMLDVEKETDKTAVKFECRYTGNKIGVINPGRAAVRLPDGMEVANARSNASPIVLMPGESDKFTLRWNRMEGGRATDMQKIKLMIVWRNTFVESDAVKLEPVTLNFRLDESKK